MGDSSIAGFVVWFGWLFGPLLAVFLLVLGGPLIFGLGTMIFYAIKGLAQERNQPREFAQDINLNAMNPDVWDQLSALHEVGGRRLE